MKNDIAFEWDAFQSALSVIAGRRPLRARQLAYATALGSTYLSLFGITRASLRLDDLLFPAHRGVEVKRPVVVTGPPRSGTTLLQNLLSLDDQHFAPLTLGDSLVPSITLRKALRGLTALDRKLGAPVARAIAHAERRGLRELADVHPLSLSAPEEDMLLTLHGFALGFVYLMVPYVEAMHARGHRLEELDHYPVERSRVLLDFYDSLVRRHLFDVGASRTFLTKNTSLTAGALRSHYQRFPDMRLILLVRRPHECLPSMLSLAHRFWSQLDPEISKTGPEFRRMYELSRDSFRTSSRIADELPSAQVKVVRYEELVASPRAVVAELYDWLELDFTPEFSRLLEERVANARSFKSRHAYSPAEFGLTAREIARELPEVYLRYGWSVPQLSVLPSSELVPLSALPDVARDATLDSRTSWQPPAPT